MAVSKQTGFTVIEIMLVISIIGLLSSIILLAVTSARVASHDAQRQSQVRQLATVLEEYYLDNNAYPTDPAAPGSGLTCDSRAPCWQNVLAPQLVPKYISTLPVDPANGKGEGFMCTGDGTPNSGCGEYYYDSNGSKFILSTYLATNRPEKVGLEWNNDAEVPATNPLIPPFPSVPPIPYNVNSSTKFYGPFFSIKGGNCAIVSFWACN